METKAGASIAETVHAAELCRLNRVIGQLEGIKKMIADDRYCVDILTQLKAVKAALKNIELNVLETHMQRCLEKAAISKEPDELKSKISELRELMRKFD